MSAKVFVSHVNWNIKTPFVSYSDKKFIDELEKNTKLNNSTIHDINLTKSKIANYFIKKNKKLNNLTIHDNNLTKSEIANYFIKKNTKLNNSTIHDNNLTKSKIANYFIKKYTFNKIKKEITITMKNNLLEKNKEDKKNNNICSLLAKIFN